MIVIGVDPGTAVTGYGVLRQTGVGSPQLLECGVVRTSPSADLASRLQEIHAGIIDVLERHRPDCMSIESVFYARNVRTTVVLGHARGVILLAGKQRGLSIFEYPPREIKKCVAGTGAATKDQVQFMVTKILRLKSAPQPDDAADGIAAALTHLQGVHLLQLLGNA